MILTRSWTDQRAFTLIEVSLAFAIMALMLLILYSSFALSSRAEEKITVRFEKNQKIRAVEGLLAGYIRSAFRYRKDANSGGIVFSGTAERLSFVSALSVLGGERGLASVTLTFSPGGEREGVLTLQETLPVRLGGGTDEGGESGTGAGGGAHDGGGGFTNEVILAEKITRVQISYLEVTEDKEEWLPDWDGSQKEDLPKGVRIILEADGVEPVEWVFPIMVEVLTVA